MKTKRLATLLIAVLIPILSLQADFNITGHCVRTDTGQVMVGGWGPSGFPYGYLSWNFAGEYTGSVPAGWSGTITPVSSIPGTFYPATRTYNNVNSHMSSQNYEFTPVTYNISGRVTRADNGQGVANVTFTNLSAYTTTDANGYYSGNVLQGWSGTVTPQHTLFGSFTPANRTYNNVMSNQINQNYVFDVNAYSISGNITNEITGLALAGITIYNLPGNPQSDSLGNYSAIVPQGFTAIVIPHCSVAGAFSPVNRVYINVIQNYTEQNYSWSALTYTISGRITSAENGLGIGGVSFSGFETSPVSDAEGYYVATVPWGFTSVVEPAHPQGGTFNPAQRTYNHLTANINQQNYQWSSTALTNDFLPAINLSVYPNPFQNVLYISCQLEKAGPVQLDIYDLKGRVVKRVSDSSLGAGAHQFFWDGTNNRQNISPNGIYLCCLKAGNTSYIRRIVFIR